MNKKNIVLGCMLLFFGLVYAQEEGKVEKMATYQTELMKTELKLTDVQEKSVADINAKYAVKILEIRDRPGGKFGKIGDIKATQEAKNAELKEILTAEQFEKYEDEILPKLRKQMKSKMK